MVRYPSVQYIRYYTDGSAARKLEPITPVQKKTVQQPVQKKRKHLRLYWDPVACLSIVVAVCLLVMMVVGVAKVSAVKAQADEMAEYVRYLESENLRLTEEYSQSYDISEIRNTAVALGMIPVEQLGMENVDIP